MSIKVKTNNNTTTVRVGQQNAIKVVASNKSAGKDMSHVKEGYFVTYVKSHMIFFKRHKGIVHVIRILHQKMDIESNLK